MKKIFLFLIMNFFVAISAVMLVGCLDNPVIEEIMPNETALSVRASKIEMLVGDESNIVANYTTKEGVSLVYTVENSAIATVDTNGKVSALNIGETKVKVEYGEEAVYVDVTVGLGNLHPTMIFEYITEDEFSILVKEKVNLTPIILFNSKRFAADDVTVTQTNSSSSVNIQGNEVVAVERGTADITVSCKWQGKTFATLSKNFKINSRNSVELLLNGSPELDETVIYTYAEFGGNTFNVSERFDLVAKMNGEDVPVDVKVLDGAELVKYSSSDKSVSSRQKSGVATLRIEFTGYGETITKDVTVTVKPSFAQYNGDAIIFSALDGDIPTRDIFGKNTILTSAETVDGEIITVVDGKLKGVEVSTSTAGQEREIIVCNESCGYLIRIKPYTKVIKTAEDLKIFNIQSVTKIDNHLTSETVFDGYYILANNIDAKSYVHQVITDDSVNDIFNYDYNGQELKEIGSNTSGGLTGVFDGQGYTVSGLTVKDQGIFGLITGGVVKNVAFEDVTLIGSGYRKNIALFAQQAKNATFENVYVQANTIYGGEQNSVQNSDARGDRALIALGLSGETKIVDCIFKYEIENTYIKYCYTYGLFGSDIGFFGQGDPTRTKLVFDNVFIISSIPMSVQNNSFVVKKDNTHVILAENEVVQGESYIDAALRLMSERFFNSDSNQNDLNEKYVRVASGVKRYDTTDDMLSDSNEYRFSSDFWHLVEGCIPYFKTGTEQPANKISGTYELDMENGFTSDQLSIMFGSSTAEIESSAMGGTALSVTNNVISGIPDSVHGQTVSLIVKITGDDVLKQINVIPITKYIRCAEDLKFFQMEDGNCTTEFAGYYVLAGNIDAEGYVHTIDPTATLAATPQRSILDDVEFNKVPTIKGLTGTFDGRGYTISNLTVNEHGIFGIVFGGTVKNVGFKNVTLQAKYLRADTALLAQKLHLATIENVYAEANRIVGSRKDGDIDAGGDRGFIADSIQGGTIKNCLFVVEIANTYSLFDNGFVPEAGKEYYHAAYGSLCARDVTEITGQWNEAGIYANTRSNVYVISSSHLSFYNNSYGTGVQKSVFVNAGEGFEYSTWNHRIVDAENIFTEDVHYGIDKDPTDSNNDGLGDNYYGHWSAGGVKRYESISEMSSDNNDYADFSEEYWDLSSGVPTWKN